MQRNLNLLTIYTFLINTVFLLPIIVPFYRDELGLTFHQFLIGEAVFAAVIILLEVPSGWLADIWGRKKTIIMAGVSSLIGYSLILSASSFGTAVLGQAVIGIGVSFHSGTLSAFLYDTLLSQGREAEYRKREGFRHGLGLYSVAFASVLGGILYQLNHSLPILVEIVFIATAIVVSFFLQEPSRHQKAVEKNAFHDAYETMKYALHGHKEIGAMIILIALTFGSTKVFLWAQQPYYAGLHIPESVYGFILAGSMLLGGLGGHFGHHILRGWQGLAVIKSLLAVVILICLTAGLALTYGGFAVLSLGAFIWGFGWPRVQETINHAVGSERRATILSTASLMFSLAFIPFSLLLGWVEEQRSITTALLVHAGVLAVFGGAFLVWLEARKKKANAEAEATASTPA